MAAHQRYPSPHEQLSVLALAARREGLSFGAFWERAVRPGLQVITWRMAVERRPVGCVVWPNDTFDRQQALEATLDPVVADGWRRAYELAPPERREAALKVLAPQLAALDAAERRRVMQRGLREGAQVPSAA